VLNRKTHFKTHIESDFVRDYLAGDGQLHDTVSFTGELQRLKTTLYHVPSVTQSILVQKLGEVHQGTYWRLPVVLSTVFDGEHTENIRS
jgi:sirohydrochlorin ferrochelatase